ncbi:MAG: IS110 family transposase [Rubrobacteraceae bacterium]
MSDGSIEQQRMTAGLDLGDNYSYLYVLDDESGERIEAGRLRTNPEGLRRRFDSEQQMKIAIEVGTHSTWISRLLTEYGHEVLVANPRKVRLIYSDKRKTDKLDAQKLARLARADPELLYPIEHRSKESQAHLALIHSRDVLVRSRTQLINHVRGAVKSFGARLPKCSARSFHKKVADHLPDELAEALEDIVATIASLTERIRGYERRIERVCKERYPRETGLLQQISGVGALTSLTYVLTLEDPERFEKSRSVGAYLGLVPGKDQSGQRDPGKRISGEGDEMLRRLLVGSAHYILGPFASDSDLRRHGEKIASRGGKNAKKRAVVAVARRLAVLLHRLWVTGEAYEPLHNTRLSGSLGEEVA